MTTKDPSAGAGCDGADAGCDSASTDERSWLARTLLPEGKEPDPRFTLANERTFLAWIRTSLAFLAGGVALEAFRSPDVPEHLWSTAAVLVLIVGMLIGLGAAVRWLRVERAMRTGKALPVPAIVPFLAGVAVVACAVVLGFVIFGDFGMEL
ncbi:YidH family protein [Corynebacterium sp. 22_2729]